MPATVGPKVHFELSGIASAARSVRLVLARARHLFGQLNAQAATFVRAPFALRFYNRLSKSGLIQAVAYNRINPIAVACALAVGASVAAFAYTSHLSRRANWITKELCDERSVLNGAYRRCVQHYAPAELGRTDPGQKPASQWGFVPQKLAPFSAN